MLPCLLRQQPQSACNVLTSNDWRVTEQVSGNFTVDDAKELAVQLRAGAPPAKLSVVMERVVLSSQ